MELICPPCPQHDLRIWWTSKNRECFLLNRRNLMAHCRIFPGKKVHLDVMEARKERFILHSKASSSCGWTSAQPMDISVAVLVGSTSEDLQGDCRGSPGEFLRTLHCSPKTQCWFHTSHLHGPSQSHICWLELNPHQMRSLWAEDTTGDRLASSVPHAARSPILLVTFRGNVVSVLL